ncbi:MAG: 50S ribosomal protein L7Ae [Euryarchaeota archaeon]|nr:50S ribosomal protein L7Ae [Euryarchaeota archaeon]MDE1835600.1 50S ribosomal protein L7Ae [Euryarchaeota archaeon]MDE1878948.1 50S ribosomal protein L7Ae [Euryarchaeota archaeon]MDE2043778.1 50S ribosomal protein L7Ae [Thermoplasmata archaeon]
MARPVFVRFETPQEIADKALQLVQVARETGKVRVGTNEVTKSSERSEAKMVVMAEDVDPAEILVHIPMLCEEKHIPYLYVQKKQRLGQVAGLSKSAASVAVVEPGEGKALLEELSQSFGSLKK